MDQAFHDEMATGYALTEPGLVIGSPMLGDELANDARVQVALSMMNRHGLIAGATGTGKTKTLQLLAGQLSKAGVPVFVADIKGDLTGMAAPGDATNPKVVDRLSSLGWTFEPSGHPVEYLSLSGKLGAQVRATTHSFGPLLLGRVLGLNDTQTSILSLIFKYCDDNQLPLLDLKDLAATLKYLASDDGKAVLADYGGMSSASVGVLLRSIVVLEQSGADIFFGEPEFDVMDLLRSTPEGEGIVSILELSDVMDQPEPVLDVHALDARPAVRVVARGRRPAQAEAVLLLRRGAPAVRRRIAGAARRDRADRASHPLEGRRRLLRDPGARPTSRPRSSPSSATASSTLCARSRPTMPTRCARPRGRSRSRPSTTSRRRSPRSGPARRWSPSCRRAASRRRSPRPGCCRPIRR